MFALLITAALTLCGILPQPDGVLRDFVDRLELNNFYDGEGRLAFTQLVGWEANGHVRFWRMAKSADMVPQRDHVYGGWVLTWSDQGTIRQVRSRSFAESWTQVDVEIADREQFPKERRVELKQPRKGR